jgi:multicomponent Na+:H+ antiporter subunit D
MELMVLDYTLRIGVLHSLNVPLVAAFVGMAVLVQVFSLSVTDRSLRIRMALHSAAGILAVSGGDLITLLAGLEMLALTGFFVIAYQGATDRCAEDRTAAAYRYLIVHLSASALVFLGAALHISIAGDISLGSLQTNGMNSPAASFILAGVCVKTAVVPFHFWLTDAYPRAFYPASVLLSVYTTKVGVYVLTQIVTIPVLPYLGATMALYGVGRALSQSSARRLLSFHVISQVGYMVAAVGIGSAEGHTAGMFHAFNNIVYKGLLFMVAGAVIRQTGTEQLSKLGGLARKMPVTCMCCIIASLSIAGVPGLSGFVGKELVKSAVGYGSTGYGAVGVALMITTIGTGLSFLKFTYHIFFKKPVWEEPVSATEAPLSMLFPMIILSGVVVAVGIMPGLVVPTAGGYQFYTLHTIRSAVIPLILSVPAWLLLRPYLSATHTATQPSVYARRAAGRTFSGLTPLQSFVRASSDGPPQIYWLVVLVSFLVLVALFR